MQKVWDAAFGKELLILTGHAGGVSGVTFSPDGRRPAAAGGQEVRIYALDMDDLMAVAKTRLTRSLTPEERNKYLHEE